MNRPKQCQPTLYRIYNNCIEVVCEEVNNEIERKGWSDVIRQDYDLMLTMINNYNNIEGQKLAICNLKHERHAIAFLASEIIDNVQFKTEIRERHLLIPKL